MRRDDPDAVELHDPAAPPWPTSWTDAGVIDQLEPMVNAERRTRILQVLSARIEGLRTRGGNPFNDLQLPQAILQLKQGAGRLIRDETDRGALMLCDPRLMSRPYGRRILKSLPPMKLTRSETEVVDFFVN